MRERPIPFSAPMVRAILTGWKAQTRRACKARTQNQADIIAGAIMDDMAGKDDGVHEGAAWQRFGCPYGQPGDRLWVREEHYRFGHWETVPGKTTKGGRLKWRFVADSDEVLYAAPVIYRKGRHSKDPATRAWHKRLARFMPQTLSRITLEVVAVRVERLQDISRGDCMAEGCPFPNMAGQTDPVAWYQELWESINGAGSWAANPWVWVVEFRNAGGRTA